MDLDALINQLNRVEPEAINWRAMADLTGTANDASREDIDEEPKGSPVALDQVLLRRLDAWLKDQNLAGDPGARTRIVNQALDAWLNEHGA